jgi:hypothetical protein
MYLTFDPKESSNGMLMAQTSLTDLSKQSDQYVGQFPI